MRSEHFDSNKELEALKNHVTVLEKQNYGLHNEIESIINIDEKARMELDRKEKLELLKSKNA